MESTLKHEETGAALCWEPLLRTLPSSLLSSLSSPSELAGPEPEREGDARAAVPPLVETYVLDIDEASRTPSPLAQLLLPPISFTSVATTPCEGAT